MIHAGSERQDDCRISGIVQRLREGCRWRALPDEYCRNLTLFMNSEPWILGRCKVDMTMDD